MVKTITIKNSWNWPVGSQHSPLGLQVYFFIISENANALTTCMGGGGGGGFTCIHTTSQIAAHHHAKPEGLLVRDKMCEVHLQKFT